MCVRRIRKKRARDKENDPLGLDAEEEAHIASHPEGEECKVFGHFASDFPHDQLAKPEYKRIHEYQTFGNDKIITNKGFRPSFGIAEG